MIITSMKQATVFSFTARQHSLLTESSVSSSLGQSHSASVGSACAEIMSFL